MTLDNLSPRVHTKNMSKLTDTEQDIMSSLEAAYLEDPSPECGRTYREGEMEFKMAHRLLKKGLVRVVESGRYPDGAKFTHFGLTDAGFDLLNT